MLCLDSGKVIYKTASVQILITKPNTIGTHSVEIENGDYWVVGGK